MFLINTPDLPVKKIVRGNHYRNTKMFITFHTQQCFLQIKTSILVLGPKFPCHVV